jgi:subtilisin family serine protease
VLSRRLLLSTAAALALAACGDQQEPTAVNPNDTPAFAATAGTAGLNVLLKTAATPAMLAELGKFGTSIELLPAINGLTMVGKASSLPSIRALPYVAGANEDGEVTGSPVDLVPVADFTGGLSTWDQDAINVTAQPFSAARISQTGEGVYIGVLDTGLLDTWRQYFPEERIAAEYAKSFGGGQGNGNIPEQPNKWEHDVNAHGTHVTSTILGYQFGANRINGTAPKATVIPVKVLGQAGRGSNVAVAKGILYIASLKAGALSGHPVVINMSLGGGQPDVLTESAVNEAVRQGVIVVASAGNSGPDGAMGYPGAYPNVISVAAAGWIGEWRPCGTTGLPADPSFWWVACDVPDPNQASNFYIADFSSRAKNGQDLDVAAPGSWVLGPYQLNSGKTSYFFVGGTSQASPHVAGIVALMAQKFPALTAAQAETILESTALPLPAGTRNITEISGQPATVSWGDDASGSGLANAFAAVSATP